MERRMATVKFSIPDEIKAAFSEAFSGQNKSAVIARLMRRAVEEKARQARRKAIIETITAQRDRRPATTERAIREARREGRS